MHCCGRQMDAGLRGIAPGEETRKHLATLDSKLAVIGGAPLPACCAHLEASATGSVTFSSKPLCLFNRYLIRVPGVGPQMPAV